MKRSEKMDNKKNISYFIIKRTIVYSLFIIGIIFIGFKNPKPLVLGYIFGTSIGILGFKLLELTINKAVIMPPKKASYYAMSQYLIRYFIYGIVLTIAALADYLNFVTAVIGLLMIKIVIITYTIYDSLIKRRKKDEINK